MNRIWSVVRPYGRIFNAFIGFMYDFKRFCRFGGWRARAEDSAERNYDAVKTYHALEKSMSFKSRSPNSGWGNAGLLLDLVRAADKHGEVGFHDRAGLSILRRFVGQQGNNESEEAADILNAISSFSFDSDEIHGSVTYSKDELLKGVMPSPEAFFFSRHSVREFSVLTVDEDVVKRAVSLAMKSPSVCNRQAWHVYHAIDSRAKEHALKLQSGNKGFGDRIPNLLIISTDLKAFVPGQERYQHWIDGGLFSMSLIYAFHSLGIASCCLNWSQSPANDKRLRSLTAIRPNHTVIMMLAVGYPDDENLVCASARRPLSDVYSRLMPKSDGR